MVKAKDKTLLKGQEAAQLTVIKVKEMPVTEVQEASELTVVKA